MSFPFRLIWFALAYWAGAELSYALLAKAGNFSAFWPPAGIYLGMLLATKQRRWWAVALAASVPNLLADVVVHGHPFVRSLGFLVVNLGAPLLAAVLIKQLHRREFSFARLSHVAVWSLVTICVSTPLGAVGGAAIIVKARGGDFGQKWFLWWIGDVLGVLTLTPLAYGLLAWRQWPRLNRVLEAAALLLSLGAAAVFVFYSPHTYPLPPSVLFLFLLWAALRFGALGVAGAATLLAVIALWATGAGFGPYSFPPTPQARSLMAQITAATGALLFYILAAVMAERRAAESELLTTNSQLDQQVRERTTELVAANQHLRASEARLATELAATQQLQTISSQLIREDDPHALYEQILDAATALMRSEASSLQIFQPAENELQLLAHKQFAPAAAQFWERIGVGSQTSCGKALADGARVIVPDVETCAFMAGTRDLEFYRLSNIRAVQSTPLVSRGGKLVGMISTHWSATQQPSARELRLFDVLARQAADLIERLRAEETLRAADRRKDEFLAMLAHELRNPLAPIRNATQVLKRTDTADAHQQRARAVIERQTQHLARLVDDLLDVSRITQGKIVLQREPLELATIINRALEASRPLIDARRQQLTVTLAPEPLRVEGDLTRLVQVVGNLLNNAAKYTDEGGGIWLAAAEESGAVVIRVRDNGIGMRAELVPHVFDLFTQAERSLDRSQGGLGIGLSLVRRLVELHGGRVEARSKGPGQGSEFIVRLPALQLADWSLPIAENPQSASSNRQLRVLVVEDNVDSAEMMGFMLKLDGHETKLVYDGSAAFAAARQFQPHVILCDIGLPGMNGYEVAQQLRTTPEFKQMHLIALSGYGQDEDRRHAQEAGFDYHLVKPVDPEALTALLASLRPDARTS